MSEIVVSKKKYSKEELENTKDFLNSCCWAREGWVWYQKIEVTFSFGGVSMQFYWWEHSIERENGDRAKAEDTELCPSPITESRKHCTNI